MVHDHLVCVHAKIVIAGIYIIKVHTPLVGWEGDGG